MAALTDIDQGRLSSLSTHSVKKFCDGYQMMFGMNFSCELGGCEIVPVSDLKSRSGRFIAVNSVRCIGQAEGHFLVILDQKALFTLGGCTVMFPPMRIKEFNERGTQEDVECIEDAIREVGNLIIGEFAIGFRTGCPQAEGFEENQIIKLDLPVPIGDVVPAMDEGVTECNLLTYNLEIGEYGPFNIYVALPIAS